jgi:parvulin-like peptidyl-prolyl isomerase
MKLEKSRDYRFLLFAAVLLLGFLGCGRENSLGESRTTSLSDASKKGNIILRIQDISYFNSDFKKYLSEIVGKNQDSLLVASLSRLYDKFVEEMLFLKAAQNQRIKLTEDEKKQYLAKMANEVWQGREQDPSKELDTQSLLQNLLIEKYTFELVKDIKVEDNEVHEYYGLHKREFLQPERVQVSQILLATEEKAIEILKQLKTVSEEEFRELARKESLGPEASKGGKMGLFKPGQLPFEMEKVVFSLKEGEISPVVESSYGYHIFRLDKRYEPDLAPESESAPDIKMKLLDQKIKQALAQNLEELKRSMDWSSYPQNLSFPYERDYL